MFDRRGRLASCAFAPIRSDRSSSRDALVTETAGEFFNTASEVLSSSCDAEPSGLVRNMLFSPVPMDGERLYDGSPSLADAENWLAPVSGGVPLARRCISAVNGRCVPRAVIAPLLYGDITGRGPDVLNGCALGPTVRGAPLSGDRCVHADKSCRDWPKAGSIRVRLMPHPEEDEQLVAASSGARKTAAKSGRR